MQVEDDRRVDVTGTGTHHQTFQRGQTHGGINTFTVADSRNRTTVAQMAGDDVQFFNRFVQELCGFLGSQRSGWCRARCGDVRRVLWPQAVRRAVEVETLPAWSDGTPHVEYGHVFVFQIRKDFSASSDTDQVCRVVQRAAKDAGIFDTLESRDSSMTAELVYFHRHGRYGDNPGSTEQTVLDFYCQKIVLTIKFSVSL